MTENGEPRSAGAGRSGETDGVRLRVGSSVEYRESGPRGQSRTIRGVVVRVIEGRELMDVRTGKRKPAVAFVIRDERGKCHVTTAMAPPEQRPARPPDGGQASKAPE